jgi:hypothetical protein
MLEIACCVTDDIQIHEGTRYASLYIVNTSFVEQNRLFASSVSLSRLIS